MSKLLSKHLANYAEDTRNAFYNFQVGLEYMQIGQKAPAISFLLRAAELTNDDDLAYTSLLLNFYNLDQQQDRKHSAKGQLLHAIALQPHRPEAYHILSLFHEAKQEWQEAYTSACIAEQLTPGKLYADVGYPGSYGPILQKAVVGWHLGHGEQSRKLFRYLQLNYNMTPHHLQVVENNLSSLGAGPVSVSYTHYTEDKHKELRVKFPGSESIIKNFSQIYQDMFVLSALNGKKEGTYIEVGGGDPFWGNNTALLEQNYGWKGRSLEFNPDLAKKYNESRINKVDCLDATTINYAEYIAELTDETDIDYLQLDCEPPRVTFEILKSIPFDKYRFAVITFEHDFAVDRTGEYRTLSREYLRSKGYKLVLGDAGPTDWYSFEDWWVHPDLVSSEFIKEMECITGSAIKAEDYMLNRINTKN